jgi:thiamine biosynthesis lipoprotein
VGGDIVLRGALTEEIAIANPKADAENDPPMDTVRLSDCTIATSGSYRRGVDVGAAHYSHIVDPRTGEATGEGQDGVISSTVIAREPAEAGALATAFSVMRPEESGRLAAKLGGVEYKLMLRNGQTIASAGWPKMQVPRLVQASYRRGVLASYGSKNTEAQTRGAAAKSAEAPMDLMITLELARMDNPRFRRPYVAVWVEDAEGHPVRSIALWSEKPRYLDELKEWYRTHTGQQVMFGGQVSPSVSSATRPPGKYTLRWDGKDDDGKALKPGKYTVYVEAVREHGTYQMQKQEINLDDKTPAQFELPAGTEIAGIQMDYGRHGQ